MALRCVLQLMRLPRNVVTYIDFEQKKEGLGCIQGWYLKPGESIRFKRDRM